jgi:DNA-binding LytR/AlgR family response regulator
MIKIGICDDDQQVLTQVEQYLHTYTSTKGINCFINSFQSGEDLICDMDVYGTYDILFLDIELSRIDGIETARYVRNRYPGTVLLFISCHSEYYKAAFDVQPFQFIDKPIEFTDFCSLCDRIFNLVLDSPQLLSFYYNHIHYNVDIRDIVYLESNKRLIRVICRDGDYEFYDKLNNLEIYLAEKNHQFIRIHKSFLINPLYVKRFEPENVIMINDVSLAISRDRRQQVRQYYLESLRGELKITGGK